MRITLTETQRKEALPPLKGLRVLDLTRYVAGPHCTLLLAEFGADVVKIERPKRGEDFRGMQPTWNGESLLFLTLNRNKRSITIDLACEQGRELVKKLAAKADILIENFRPGTMEKLGLSWETLHAINPRLVMASASGFGQSGPYAKRPAYDVIGQALGGLMHMTGSQDGQPTMTGTVVVDYATALYVTIGVMMALRSRDQTGVGQLVEGSLLGTAVSLLMGWIPEYAMLGHEARRHGNRDKYSVPGICFVPGMENGFTSRPIPTSNSQTWRRASTGRSSPAIRAMPPIRNGSSGWTKSNTGIAMDRAAFQGGSAANAGERRRSACAHFDDRGCFR